MKAEVLIIGAGAAGLMCALRAAQRGKKVTILEASDQIGNKIIISGGGRCNFTNLLAEPSAYVSENEHFCKSALAKFTPEDFIKLVKKHQIPFHEKKLGQLFCTISAKDIVSMLESEVKSLSVRLVLNSKVELVEKLENSASKSSEEKPRFLVKTSTDTYECESLVIATGGQSIPQMGASDWGYRLAKQMGLRVTELAPALVSLTMDMDFQKHFSELSGMSLPCRLSVGKKKFEENILFTHHGLSGPAILQASLYWHSGEEIFLDLLPEEKNIHWLLDRKKSGERTDLKNILSEVLPKSFAEKFLSTYFSSVNASQSVQQISNDILKELSELMKKWKLTPKSTGGYGKAEVTRGGVSTNELSSKTMESKKNPGLYFIGEVVDVTGMLGGYNFQWAWSSGYAAGEAL